MSTYTVDEVFAMQAKKWDSVPVPYGNGYMASVAEMDGAAWQPIGYISEDAWDKAIGGPVTEPPPPPKCPHCSRDFHADPLTKRVADMVRNHKFDPAYKAAEDESPVECVGSDTYGPNRPAYDLRTNAWVGNGGIVYDEVMSWPTNAGINTLITQTIKFATDQMWSILVGGKMPLTPWVTFHDKAYEPLPPCPPDLELDVQFGPEHWPVEHASAPFSVRHFVSKVHPDEWREPIPLPASPGLDVSVMAEEFNKKHNWNGVNK